MVKLIRLTSDDNANFQANFDAEIKLKEQSQVALQNLTFESNFDIINVNPDNWDITSQFDDLDDTVPAVTDNIQSRQYTGTNYLEFFDELQGGLNKTLELDFSSDTPNIYSSFKVGFNKQQKIEIKYQYSSMSLLFNTNELVRADDASSSRYTQNKPLMNISEDEEGDPTIAIKMNINQLNVLADIGNMESTVTDHTDELDTYVCNMKKEFMFSNGTGMFMTYIKKLVDDAAATSEESGYGMGLSYTDLSGLSNQQIPATARDFEIIVEKTTDFYSFINPTTGAKTPSTLLPHDITHGVDNDHLIFQRSGNIIKASIWNISVPGGLETVLFSYELPLATQHKPLYPYIYIKGGSDHARVGRPVMTFDSIFEENDDFTYINPIMTIGGMNPPEGGVYKNIFELLDEGGNNFENLTPSIDNDRLQIADLDQVFRINIHNEILRFLGFSRTKYFSNTYSDLTSGISADDPVAFGTLWTADNLFQLVNSDSYAVEILNLPIQSFDASVSIKNSNIKRGKRRNILAVIPKNDSSGIIEFEANEVLYIDINNAEPININNLNLRVLNKKLEPIETSGVSVITLLFKDGV
tara:strand:+ start:417 stop:2165 length:1749 start_codon:yes stop_codon:yes gene_type:complete